MNDAFGDIRNATAAATSPGVPSRPSGAACSKPIRISSMSSAICHIGVRMKPGHTALMRIPKGPNCAAIDRVMPNSPALDAQ